MSEQQQLTSIQWLLNELSERFPNEVKEMYQNNQLQFENIVSKAKQMEERQKGYNMEQMLQCWNTAIKFESYGPGFVEFLESLKSKQGA
jgi:hypothetical protein